jgi:hypothetical protein
VYEKGGRGECSKIGVVGRGHVLYTVHWLHCVLRLVGCGKGEEAQNNAMAGRLRSSRMNEQVLEEGLRKEWMN